MKSAEEITNIIKEKLNELNTLCNEDLEVVNDKSYSRSFRMYSKKNMCARLDTMLALETILKKIQEN